MEDRDGAEDGTISNYIIRLRGCWAVGCWAAGLWLPGDIFVIDIYDKPGRTKQSRQS